MSTEPYMSETAKHRGVTIQFCVGNGVDIGSGGDPVVPNAISIDLPEAEYKYYNSNQPHRGNLNFRCDGRLLPFKDETLDWVYSSHLLEDFLDWWPILTEWTRVLKRGGHLIILVPDKTKWNEAIQRGQPPNCQHQHESHVGELSKYAKKLGLQIVMDQMASTTDPLDYSIVFVGKKI